ncbi:hypothetical protein ISCGN_027828 [Ixodes scapularis]
MPVQATLVAAKAAAGAAPSNEPSDVLRQATHTAATVVARGTCSQEQPGAARQASQADSVLAGAANSQHQPCQYRYTWAMAPGCRKLVLTNSRRTTTPCSSEASVALFSTAGLLGRSVTGTSSNRTKSAPEPALDAVPLLVLTDLNKISDYKVSVTPHRTLNSCQGVISEDDLLESSEEEILEGLSGQGVVAVRRIFIRRDGQERPTKHLVLTFPSTVLPENIKAGYLHCKGAPVKAGVWRVASSRTPSHAGSPAHVWLCVAFPCPGKRASWWLSRAREARRRFAFLRKGGFAQVLQRGPAPLKVAVATQTSFPDARKPLQSPTPQLKLQLPGRSLSSGRPTSPSTESCTTSTGQQPVPSRVEGSQAVSPTQDGSAVSTPISASRSPSNEKGPRSRLNSSEGASSSKERHDSCATPPAPKGQEQVGLGDCLPSTSAPPAGGGRGRGFPPRAQNLSKPARTASAQEAELMEEGAEPSTPASDPDDMEWQVPKGKHKSKKPIVPPK